MEDFAIVRNVQNNQLYMYVGENKYKNMITGIEGEIDPETARKVFRINLHLTEICYEFPKVQELISRLNLKIDNNLNHTGSGNPGNI